MESMVLISQPASRQTKVEDGLLARVLLIRTVARLTPAGSRTSAMTELASKEVLLGGNTLIIHAVLINEPTYPSR
jgi:hypothetical protein